MGDMRRETEDGDWEWKMVDGRQTAGDRTPATGDRRREMEDENGKWEMGNEGRGHEMGDGKYTTGDGRWETGHMRQGTGNRR